MASKHMLVAYYSESGKTKKMAEAISRGAKMEGVTVDVRQIEECGVNDLAEADGIVIGSPTYFSNVAWQVKKLIDESIALYRKSHQLKGRVGGCFTSSGTHRDGKDCLRMLEIAFGLHHRMKIIPGIIGSSDDPEEEVSKKCQEYGRKIAEEIRSPQ